jgi:hypothetical protein
MSYAGAIGYRGVPTHSFRLKIQLQLTGSTLSPIFYATSCYVKSATDHGCQMISTLDGSEDVVTGAQSIRNNLLTGVKTSEELLRKVIPAKTEHSRMLWNFYTGVNHT